MEYSANLDWLPASVKDPSPLLVSTFKSAFQLFSTLEVLALTRDSLDWYCELATFMLHFWLTLQSTTGSGTFCIFPSWYGFPHSMQVLFSRLHRFMSMTKAPLRSILVMSKPSPARLDPGANSASLHSRGRPLVHDWVVRGMRVRWTATRKVTVETPMVKRPGSVFKKGARPD